MLFCTSVSILYLMYFILDFIYSCSAVTFNESGTLHVVYEDCLSDIERSTIELFNDPEVKLKVTLIPCNDSFIASTDILKASCSGCTHEKLDCNFVVAVASHKNIIKISEYCNKKYLLPVGLTSKYSSSFSRTSEETCSYLVNNDLILKNFLVSWIMHQGWTNVIIVLENSFVEDHIKSLESLRLLVSKNIRVTTISIRDRETDEHFLISLHKEWKFFKRVGILLFARNERASELLLAASNISESFFKNTGWLVISDNVSLIQDNCITFEQCYYVDWTFNSQKLQDRISQAMILARTLVKTGNFGCNFSTSQAKADLPSVRVQARPINYLELLNPPVRGNISPTKLYPVYEWRPLPEDTLGIMTYLPRDRIFNMNGFQIIVVSVSGLPFVRYGPERTNKSCQPEDLFCAGCQQPLQIEGYLVDILKILSLEMNFTYKLYSVCDKQYGTKLSNGSWTGVVKDILDHKAHLAIANLAQNYDREKAVQFLPVSTSYGGAGILLKKASGDDKDKFTVYMKPFTFSVWMTILVYIPVVSFLLLWIERSNGVFKKCVSSSSFFPIRKHKRKTNWNSNNKTVANSSSFFTSLRIRQKFETQFHNDGTLFDTEDEHSTNVFQDFSATLWFTLGAMLQQGYSTTPIKLSSRFVFISIWVSSVVLYAAYTSRLVSFFTISRVVSPINSLEDLVTSSEFSFGSRAGSTYISNFKSSPNNLHQLAYEKLISFGESTFVLSNEEALEKITNKSWAFIADYVVLDYYQRTNCELYLLPEQIFKQVSSVAIPLGSPLLPGFSYYLLKLRDSGVVRQLESKWWPSNSCDSQSSAESSASYQALTVEKVMSAFLIFAGGVGGALVICSCEFLLKKSNFCKQQSETKRNQRNTFF